MTSDPLVWLLRIVWLALPFTLGDAIGAALDGRSGAVVTVGAAMSWLVWIVGLVASFITVPAALTALRWVAPAAPVAAIALLFIESPAQGDIAGTSIPGVIGLAAALIAAACALSGQVADNYANGASYGDERRFALKVPLGLILGPIPGFWLLSVPGSILGILALAAKNWAIGVPLTVVGVAISIVALRSVHLLNRRWLVFVPAGVTLVDHLALVDPALFPKARITHFGPAYTDTTATDLTSKATGLVLEMAFDIQVDISRRTGRDGGEVTLVNAVLISPVRPGAVMREAAGRGLNTPVPTAS
ncbi:MAG: hypothetical protein GX868_08810 [Actinobacteria bacterium]|nr:hypothetical protein [Actinomycetota bacterium]